MRVSLLVLFSLFNGLFGFAQLSTNSPYSAYGFGERGPYDHAVFTGIGNCYATYFDSTLLNFYNPSTYNTLGDGQPIFSIGVNARLSTYTENENELKRRAAMVDHFAMGFTLKKHFGIAFGLKPYAKKGYQISETIYLGNDSIRNSYLGNGGINQFFIGLSTNLLKFKTTTLSVGSNLSYLFGTSTDERRSQFLDANPVDGGIGWHSVKMSSFQYSLGAYFKQSIKQRHIFTLSAIVEPEQQLQSTFNESIFYGIVGNPSTYDTLFSTGDLKGSLKIPTSTTIGLNYTFWFNDAKNFNKVRNSEISLHVSYASSDWTNFSSSFDINPYRLQSTSLSAGFQYQPERKYMENASVTKFFEKVRYRIGGYMNTLPYSFAGEQLTDKAVSIGFGIPILSQNSLSSIQIAYTYGMRTSKAEGSFNEDYMGLSLGVILAPASFERWFRKKKLD